MNKEDFIFPVRSKRTRAEKYALIPTPREENKNLLRSLVTALVIILIIILGGKVIPPNAKPESVHAERREFNLTEVKFKYFKPKPQEKKKEEKKVQKPTEKKKASIPPKITSSKETQVVKKGAQKPRKIIADLPRIKKEREWALKPFPVGNEPSPIQWADFEVPRGGHPGEEPRGGNGGGGDEEGNENEGGIISTDEFKIDFPGVVDERIRTAIKKINVGIRYMHSKGESELIGDNTRVEAHVIRIRSPRSKGNWCTISYDTQNFPIVTYKFDVSGDILEELAKIFEEDFDKKFPGVR